MWSSVDFSWTGVLQPNPPQNPNYLEVLSNDGFRDQTLNLRTQVQDKDKDIMK